MNPQRQIIKAMAVIRRPRDGALLVSESPGSLFQRPPGGHVEFGEYALDTVHREFREELAQELTDVRRLGVLENRRPAGGGGAFRCGADGLRPVSGLRFLPALCGAGRFR